MDSKNKTLIIAHRGASKYAPENTLKAFLLAIELGADYIEFDVRQSNDNKILIIHDPYILRTTHRLGRISKMDLEKIKSLNAGNGEKVPTLDELISDTKGKIKYMCEIKVKGISETVINTLKNQNAVDSTLLISFKHKELLKNQQIYPDLKLGAIIPSGLGWIKTWFFKKKLISSISDKNFFSINPFFPLVNKKFVNFAHEKGLKVFPWTVNSKRTMKKLIKIGVDGILTNNIKKLQNYL